MIVWQEKLQSPNNDVLIETYNLLTDGRGESNKMPTIAEFMSVYKEREQAFIRDQDIKISREFPSRKSDKEYNKQRVREIIDVLEGGEKVYTHLCDLPHEGVQNDIKFRMTRDAHGRDHCYYYNHPRNID